MVKEVQYDVQHEFFHQVFISPWFDFIYQQFRKSYTICHCLAEGNIPGIFNALSTHRLTLTCKHQNLIRVRCFMPIVLKNILFHWSTQLTDRNKPYKSKFHTNKSITFSTVWLYFFQKVRENELMQFLARHLGACNQAQTSHRLKGPLMFGTTALRYPPKFSTVSLLVYIWLYWL